jgi:hypothetical protein
VKYDDRHNIVMGNASKSCCLMQPLRFVFVILPRIKIHSSTFDPSGVRIGCGVTTGNATMLQH